MSKNADRSADSSQTPMALAIGFFLSNRLLVALLVILFVVWGYMVAPFDWSDRLVPRDPVPVDAIPDIGENQQIVFTEWAGRSPQDVEDQVTYPLTSALLGTGGVKTVRSLSMFGFSSIYVIFDEEVPFEESRWRILEKLASLPSGALPSDVQPQLGPDSTALGQVFWYTLEGRDAQGRPTGGWDLGELRSIQDWYVRYALLSADGVSEVAGVGGFVQEYQIDVDPDAMRAADVTLEMVVRAVQNSNLDVGARTIEINRVEYVIRGLGLVESLEDIDRTVVTVRDNVPIYVSNVAHVTRGPGLRRGALDKAGAEAVGGVVVVRYGENPLATIANVKQRIAEIADGLPRKTLPDGRVSQVTIVPFYDRTGLIHETLDTLGTALSQQVLVTVIVVLVMIVHLRSSLLIAGLLPLAVLMSFIAMRLGGVDANIVALSGIAIAIGTMVDMGIVICENILQETSDAPDTPRGRFEAVFRAARDVGGAVAVAAATTIVSFLPVFTMEAAEGKLFKPLAYTKTFALVASLVVSVAIIPAFAYMLLSLRGPRKAGRWVLSGGLIAAGVAAWVVAAWWAGAILAALGAWYGLERALPGSARRWVVRLAGGAAALVLAAGLAVYWLPLGPSQGLVRNFLFVIGVVGGFLLIFYLYSRVYPTVLRWSLDHKVLFLLAPLVVVAFGATVWLGFPRVFGWLPMPVRSLPAVVRLAHALPGLGKEFMPSLDEGAFLWMPTTMPHASIGEVMDIMRKQDMAMQGIYEVESVVGKLGRADTPLDPAPVSMIETIVNYSPEFLRTPDGRRGRYRYDPAATDLFRDPEGRPVSAPDGEPYRVRGKFLRDGQGQLAPDRAGRPFRLWRPALDPSLNPERQAWRGIRSPDDIWDEIVRVAQVPGSTSAPMLQPIETRLVMLQTGMRAPMGIKVKGPDLKTIERVGLEIEKHLKNVPAIRSATIAADRIVGKPYLEIDIDRQAVARYGIQVGDVQRVIEVAIGGRPITQTIEGRERYPVRIRYQRELRDTLESLGRILVAGPSGEQIPLELLAEIRYVRGPQMIRSEDTFLVGYVTFGASEGYAEVDVVEQARAYLDAQVRAGNLEIPSGVSYRFAGEFENQVRATRRLRVVLPLALFIIFLILYFKFRSVSVTAYVFSGVAVAWAGGFILLWLYGREWFLDFHVFGENLRSLFQVGPVNLSVAIWVGFLALFGIATDDGVVMATFVQDSLRRRRPDSREEARRAIVEAGRRRIRPCMMTTATTILALLPVLTSTGRGSDIMVPMAIPSFGGMLIELMTTLVVPVLMCWRIERRLDGAGVGPMSGGRSA